MAEPVRPAPGTGPDQDPNVVYALGSSPGESSRLQRQADELAADSAYLLDRVGLRPGQSAIDLGCGPRGILDLLAERVSPAERVVGLDADRAHTAMAAEFAAGRGLSGVQVMTADARNTGLATGSFDLVHARTLLVNLPDPADVAAEMVRLARPGGWVASMEPDTEYVRCYPPHPAFDRLCDIFTVAFRRNGADPWIGRRVAHLSARQDWAMSRQRPGCRCTRRATPAGPSASTWCAACGHRCWRWAWPALPNSMSWMWRPGLILTTPKRSRYTACSS
jgi:ubiquinone/menaquinone biosynthesis C-methylase UbiE